MNEEWDLSVDRMAVINLCCAQYEILQTFFGGYLRIPKNDFKVSLIIPLVMVPG
jgi:hypothetical protein